MGFFFILRKIIDIMISHLENFELKNAKISIKAQFLSSASEWKRQKNIIQLEGTRTADLQKVQTFFFQNVVWKKMDRASRTFEYTKDLIFTLSKSFWERTIKVYKGSLINDGWIFLNLEKYIDHIYSTEWILTGWVQGIHTKTHHQ